MCAPRVVGPSSRLVWLLFKGKQMSGKWMDMDDQLTTETQRAPCLLFVCSLFCFLYGVLLCPAGFDSVALWASNFRPAGRGMHVMQLRGWSALNQLAPGMGAN